MDTIYSSEDPAIRYIGVYQGIQESRDGSDHLTPEEVNFQESLPVPKLFVPFPNMSSLATYSTCTTNSQLWDRTYTPSLALHKFFYDMQQTKHSGKPRRIQSQSLVALLKSSV